MHDIYYNDAIAGPTKSPIAISQECFTDATPSTIGVFIPGIAWLDIEADTFTSLKLDIAHMEFIALIGGYIFTAFMCRTADRIHIHVDNQNAQQWAGGHIHTSNNIANQLTLVNAVLQAALQIDQTRSYIDTEENVDADDISRRRFKNSERLPHYWAGKALLTFFADLLRRQDSDPSQIAAELRTILASDASLVFFECR
jgi:hypothetical protein